MGIGLSVPIEQRNGAGQHDAIADAWPILFDVHDLLERLAEFRIEYRVNHRIDEAVHVAEPCGEDECRHARIAVGIAQFRAQCVQHVTREERHPAEEEDACACGWTDTHAHV